MTQEEIRIYLDIARLSIMSIMLVIVVYTDLTKGKVYNWCTLGGLLVALGIAFIYTGLDTSDSIHLYSFGSALKGMGMGFVVMFLFYLSGGIKFGDVKLMTAIGCFLGYPEIGIALVMSAMVGAITAFAILIWKGKLQDGLQRAGKMLIRWKAPEVPEDKEEQEKQGFIMMPYGFAIAMGTLITLLYSKIGMFIFQ